MIFARSNTALRQPEKQFRFIFVINLGQLGDVILSLPALRAIRNRFPDAYIVTMTGKIPGEVVRMSATADEVLAIDRVALRDGPRVRSIIEILSLVRQIRKLPIDLVIDLHSLPETNMLAFLTRAKHRLLADRESRSINWLGNYKPAPPKENKALHLTDRYLDVLTPLGVDNQDRSIKLVSSLPGEIAAIEEKLALRSGQRVGIFPGAGHPSRCWSLDKFAELAHRIEKQGANPVIFLGPEEASMKGKLISIFTSGVTIIDGLSISQFVTAMGSLDAFVSNDTGPVHLAACSGVPIILLLDERAPVTYLPLSDQVDVIRNSTIDDISVDDVFHSVNRVLEASR